MRLGRCVLPAFIVAACRLAWPDTGEQPVAKATAESPRPGTVAPLPQGSEPAPSSELQRILTLLARRAELHHSLLYRFQCMESLTRKVQRRPGYVRSGFIPEETIQLRYGIVVEQGEDGVAKVIRAKVDSKGHVKLDKHGKPVEADLPAQFDSVENAVPHAEAATFTSKNQEGLVFHLLSDLEDDDDPVYRIKCPEGHVAVEFLDRQPPRFSFSCHADSSGQMCLDQKIGEISALVFYGLDREVGGCFWNRDAPFALIEQGTIETRTGARFPSRMTTIYSINSRDNAIFEQLYEECGFTHVEVTESYGAVAGKDAP